MLLDMYRECVCMCVCTHVCMCACVYACAYTYIIITHSYNTHTRARARAHTHTHTHTFRRARTRRHTFISASHSRHFFSGISPVSELKTIACESPAQATYILRGTPSLLLSLSSQQAIAVAPVATCCHCTAPLVQIRIIDRVPHACL